MVVRLVGLVAIAFSLLSICLPAAAEKFPATVISTGDGDTLRLRRQGQTITVRLGCIDSPEIAQKPYGQQSAARLKQLLPPGSAVQVREMERDRYGRVVAELYKGNQLINLQLVKEGQAVVYRQYLSGCAATKAQYLQAEAEAQQKRLGFWHQSSPVMPWEFRRAGRSSSPPPKPSTPTATPQTNQLPACVNSDCNCSDFQSQAQVRRVLVAFPGDPFGLDRDEDGQACESLR